MSNQKLEIPEGTVSCPKCYGEKGVTHTWYDEYEEVTEVVAIGFGGDVATRTDIIGVGEPHYDFEPCSVCSGAGFISESRYSAILAAKEQARIARETWENSFGFKAFKLVNQIAGSIFYVSGVFLLLYMCGLSLLIQDIHGSYLVAAVVVAIVSGAIFGLTYPVNEHKI